MEVEGARAAIKETAFIFWEKIEKAYGLDEDGSENDPGNQKAVDAIHRLMRIRRKIDLVQSDYLRAEGNETDAYARFNDEADRPSKAIVAIAAEALA